MSCFLALDKLYREEMRKTSPIVLPDSAGFSLTHYFYKRSKNISDVNVYNDSITYSNAVVKQTYIDIGINEAYKSSDNGRISSLKLKGDFMMASPSGTQDRVRTAWKVFVTPNAILDTDLTIYEKMAYITIARHANSDGTGAYPSYSTIAKEGSMGRTSAIVAVKGLVEKGYLIKESRRAVEGDRTSNLYTLLDVPESKQHEPEVVRHTHHRSVQGELGVVHVTHHRGTPDAPELNPLTKPSEQTPLTYTAETQPPVCVMAEIDLKIAELQQKTKDALGVMLEQKELIKWLQTYDETYILTKVKIIQEQGSGSNNPVRSLRAAIKQDWQQAPPIASDTTKSFAKKGCNHTADETDRVVPAAQPGKYERFYQVYQKKTDKLDTTR